MQCSRCAAENDAAASVCVSCGLSFSLRCPGCGGELPAAARFCPACGRPLTALPAPPAAVVTPPAEAARTPETTSLAERRQVTVLFSDVVNFTMQSDKQDAEDVRDRMDALWARLDPIVAQHGGLVTQHSGDGVMALFGAGQARESAPRQAVRAALAMQAALVDFRPGGLPVQMRTGIHTGPVVLGTVGTTGQLTALGDPVNLASRLEGEAPVGGVLISHDTYRQVYGFFDVQAVPAFTVKGKAERVKAYLVLRAKPRPLALRLHGVEGVETQMVGRAEELQRLQRAFEEVLANGKARFLTVVGEAGIGKSRLVHEFQQWAELRPETVRLFAGRATEEGTQVPFALLRDLLSVRFEIQETDPPAVAREKLERGLVSFLGGDGAGGTDAPAQAHFIGHMLGLDFSASPYLQGVLQDAEQIRQRAFFYLTGLFQAVARGVRLPGEAALSQAALVVLEDVHWADNASLDFIAHLMRTCADVPLLVLCLARSTLFERRPRWAEGLPQHERMDLKALSPGQRLTLVESILHKAREVPEPLRDLLVGVTEGNPYFIEEMVKMLVDQKVIIPSAEEWRIEPARLAAAAIPPTLTGVLQARADSLPETERAVLQRASVIGRNFWDTTLERLSAPEAKQDGLSAEQIHRALHALQRKEIIFPRQTSAFSGATEYFFKHELMRKVVYGNVMRRQRRVFHAQTALWLIAESGERVTEFAGLVAGHFEHADLPLDAAEWYGKAGQQANVGYAPASAIHSFQKALALLAAAASAPASAAAQRMEWQEGIGEALSAQARFGEAEAAYRAMRDEAEAARDALAQARAWNGLAFLHERSGDNRASLAAAERAEALARGLGEEAAARTERIRALHLKGWAFYRLGDARMVLALADETLELCTRFEDRRGQARSLKLHGVGHLQLGHYAEADRAFAQGLKLCRELGDWRNAAAMLSNLGESARLRGDCQAAAPLYREALALAREIEHRESEMIYLTNLGGALVGLEQFAQAEAGLRKVIELTSLPNSCGLSETYSLLAEACLGQQQTDDALAAAQQALALAKASGSNLDEGGAWRTLGRVIAALPRGRRARAAQKGAPTPRTCFQRSLSVFRQMKAEGEQARTLRAWAQYELQQRRADDSRKMWAEARTLFQRLGLEAEVQKMDALMPGRRQASRARAREPVRARRLPRRPPKARTAKPHRG